MTDLEDESKLRNLTATRRNKRLCNARTLVTYAFIIFVILVFVSSIRVCKFAIKGDAHDRPRHQNMSQRTKKYLHVLKRINKLADKNKKEYVRKCNREFIDCLSECSTNVLRGKVPRSSRQGAKLKRNKKDLRLLSAKKTSLRKKRHIVQKGVFLGALVVGWTRQ